MSMNESENLFGIRSARNLNQLLANYNKVCEGCMKCRCTGDDCPVTRMVRNKFQQRGISEQVSANPELVRLAMDMG